MAEELDPWDWWRRRMAGEPMEMNPDNPHLGFYRMPRKEHYGARKTFTPVAYYIDADGVYRCREGDREVDDARACALWQSVGHHPVSEEAYREVAERGGIWPDEHELVGMGHNEPPEEMSFEYLRDAIEPLSVEADRRLDGEPIKDQAECDRIANLADRLAELHKNCDELYKVERAPLDAQLKELRIKWGGLQLKAEVYKNLKYKLVTPWLKYLEQVAKKAAEQAAQAGTPSPAEPRRARAGTRGRAMTLKTTKRAEITDYDKCWAFFKEAPEMKTLVQDLADRIARTGMAVPGCKIVEEEKAV